ncbi:uncharacterized protein LOC134532029 [Bacillus rossius redtenbacheri]|uniref:uncharacterized protein LOC134532029 n=1 Tax=Bacillus rossius redtenbacheri TaxID=93214 RepID=UPI002FDDBB1B
MAAIARRLLAVLLLAGVSSATSGGIFRGVVDMVLHPRETLGAAVRTAAAAAARVPDAVLARGLDGSRGLLRRAHPLLGLPALDPCLLRRVDASHRLPGVSEMKGHLSDVTVRGLSAYRVRRLAVNWADSTADLGLSFPEIDVDGSYSVKGTFAEFLPVFGEGPFRVNIRDLELNTVVCLSYLNKTLSVDALDLDYKFKHFESKFAGLMGGGQTGEAVNEVINEKAPQLLVALSPVLKPLLVRHILGGVNSHLRRVALSRADLLSWLPAAWRGADVR